MTQTITDYRQRRIWHLCICAILLVAILLIALSGAVKPIFLVLALLFLSVRFNFRCPRCKSYLFKKFPRPSAPQCFVCGAILVKTDRAAVAQENPGMPPAAAQPLRMKLIAIYLIIAGLFGLITTLLLSDAARAVAFGVDITGPAAFLYSLFTDFVSIYLGPELWYGEARAKQIGRWYLAYIILNHVLQVLNPQMREIAIGVIVQAMRATRQEATLFVIGTWAMAICWNSFLCLLLWERGKTKTHPASSTNLTAS